MRKSMTSDALPHRGTAAPFRVAIGLALAASASVMLWVVGTHCVSASEFGRNAAGENRGFTRYAVAYLSVSASEFGRNAVGETPMTLEDRVAALTAELAQVKAETAKLRESQSDTSEELSHFRASLANAEIGLAALRTTTEGNEAHRRDTAAQVKAETAKLRESQSDTSEELSHFRASLANAEIGLAALGTTTAENEAHQRDTAAQVKAETAKLKDEMLHLRLAQDDTATDIGSLRAGVANSEIGVDSLRATTGELRQQIERIEAARDATGSIAKSRKHQGHKKWVAQR
jgi:chromosome segregation ATPase